MLKEGIVSVAIVIIVHAFSQKPAFHLKVTEYDHIVVTPEMKAMQIFPPVLWLSSIITPLRTIPNNQPKLFSASCLIQHI